MGARDGEGLHAAAFGGFDAHGSVFEYDAPRGRDGDEFGGLEKDFGVGFAVVYVFGGDKALEERGDAGHFQDERDIFALGGGANDATDAGGAQALQKRAGAGKDFDAAGVDKLAVKGFLAEREAPDLGSVGGPAELSRDDDLVFHAEAAFEMAFGERLPAFAGEHLPTLEVEGGGIDNDSVPVKDGAEGGHAPRR